MHIIYIHIIYTYAIYIYIYIQKSLIESFIFCAVSVSLRHQSFHLMILMNYILAHLNQTYEETIAERDILKLFLLIFYFTKLLQLRF